MAQQNCKTPCVMWGSHRNVAENSSLPECDIVWLADCDILKRCGTFTFNEYCLFFRLTDPEEEDRMIPWNGGNYSSNSTVSRPKLLWSSRKLVPPLMFCITSQWVKALTNDNKHNYLLIKQTIWFECSPLHSHTQQNLMSHTHLYLTVSTFLTAKVGAWMLTR
jgi:hypothetical protein